jgi:hypothetical protein
MCELARLWESVCSSRFPLAKNNRFNSTSHPLYLALVASVLGVGDVGKALGNI